MTNSEDKPPPAVGAYWIKEEDYPALLQLFDDGDKMPPSWKEWLKMAEEMEQGLKAYGHVVLRVYIDPATFPDWCAAHGTSPGSAGRRKFVAAAVTERYGRHLTNTVLAGRRPIASPASNSTSWPGLPLGLALVRAVVEIERAQKIEFSSLRARAFEGAKRVPSKDTRALSRRRDG
jgi:hypothetical protein